MRLASRKKRLLGAILDSLFCALILTPLFWLGGVFKTIANQHYLNFWEQLLLYGASFAVFVALNGHFLAKEGQTLAKKLLKMRIVDLEGNLLPLSRLLFYRYFLLGILGFIPFLGLFVGLADALFIFGPERRCLHDYLAGTIVIDLKED